MEEENVEQEILLEPESVYVSPVYSVNGKTGNVVLTTSDLENDSDYQTGSDVANAISGHNESEEAHPYIQGLIDTKQDALTAGANIQISEQNVISATDTTYTAGDGINISAQNAVSVDTNVVATQQNLADEVTNRENADIALQGQIDAISASSDVVDIVGTYAELQAYDTQHLKDNDIIKVLQDETQGNATTYYRWSTSTHAFTLIGQEGPYYTKAGADAQFVPQTRTVNSKALSSNITLTASDIGAVDAGDVVQTTGTSTTQIMSQKAVTDQLATKLDASAYVVDDHLANTTNPVQNQVLNGLLGNMPSDFFSGSATTNPTPSTNVVVNNGIDLDDVEMLGDTYQQTYSGKNLARNAYQSPVTLNGVTFTSNADGTITANGTATAGINFYLNGDDTRYRIAEGTYTLSAGVTSSDSTYFVFIDGTSSVYWNSIYDARLTQTVPSGGIDISARIVVRSGAVLNNVVFKLQLEAGSTATSFEPFVGGTASPNPDYPQNIQVVTGEQTVTVSGDNQNQNYTVNLGTIELCKIGTYQDKIYKSGDDWYVHKETGNQDMSGLSGINVISTGNFVVSGFNSNYGAVIGEMLSNILTYSATDWEKVGKFGIAVSGNLWAMTGDSTITNANIATWLSDKGAVVYYALATPTDTKITDVDLIAELEALLGATIYEGQTNFEVTASSLAGILDLTAINANANGIVYKLRNS